MPDLFDPWPVPATMRAWHAAITDLTVHTAFCGCCLAAEKWDHERRCHEGQLLYLAEQAAYRSHISDQYAGRAAA